MYGMLLFLFIVLLKNLAWDHLQMRTTEETRVPENSILPEKGLFWEIFTCRST